jgi:hypothetical protein
MWGGPSTVQARVDEGTAGQCGPYFPDVSFASADSDGNGVISMGEMLAHKGLCTGSGQRPLSCCAPC